MAPVLPMQQTAVQRCSLERPKNSALKTSACKGSLQPWVASKMVVERVEKVLLPHFQGLELHPDLLSQEGTAP